MAFKKVTTKRPKRSPLKQLISKVMNKRRRKSVAKKTKKKRSKKTGGKKKWVHL
jgi:hypothetical protein